MALSAVSMLVAMILAPISLAAAPVPAAGTAVVDGDPGEWSPAADFFTTMTHAGDPSRPVVANLHLRYDCEAGVLYGLVLTVDGHRIKQSRADEAYLRIDGAGKLVSGLSGNDGTAPDFAWVGSDGTLADGFEASGPLAPGSYTIRAHALIDDDSADGYTSIDTVPRDGPLVIECQAPTEDVAPTEAAAPTGAVAPTEAAAPTGAVAPTEAAAPDTGNVEGVTGTPRVTLPPTDIAAPGTSTLDAGGPRAALLALVAVIALALAFVPRRARSKAR